MKIKDLVLELQKLDPEDEMLVFGYDNLGSNYHKHLKIVEVKDFGYKVPKVVGYEITLGDL